MDKYDFDKLEQLAAEAYDSNLSTALMNCINYIRELEHKLNDPNYMYANGRIKRQALIIRDASIDRLRKELKTVQDNYNDLMSAIEKFDPVVREQINNTVNAIVEARKVKNS